MLKELPPFSAARKQLGEFAPTGEEFAVDAFWALLKAEPELLPTDAIHPDDLVNRRIAEMMAELDAYDRLRRYSVNDDVQAALSVVTMEPDIETLFDKTKMQREKAEQLRQALQSLAQSQKDLEERQRDLDDLIREWGGDPADPELQGEKPEEPEQGDGEGDDGEQQGEGEGMEGENLPGGTPQPGDGDGDGHRNQASRAVPRRTASRATRRFRAAGCRRSARSSGSSSQKRSRSVTRPVSAPSRPSRKRRPPVRTSRIRWRRARARSGRFSPTL
jgi:hypothetical protein